MNQENLWISEGFWAPSGAELLPKKKNNLKPPTGQIPDKSPWLCELSKYCRFANLTPEEESDAQIVASSSLRQEPSWMILSSVRCVRSPNKGVSFIVLQSLCLPPL